MANRTSKKSIEFIMAARPHMWSGLSFRLTDKAPRKWQSNEHEYRNNGIY